MKMKTFALLIAGLFLITTLSVFTTVNTKASYPQPQIEVWITSVGHYTTHDISGWHVHLDVSGDSNNGGWGNLYLWYRKSMADTWHLSDDEAGCPGTLYETLNYDDQGSYTIFLKLQLGNSGPLYFSDVYEYPITLSLSSNN